MQFAMFWRDLLFRKQSARSSVSPRSAPGNGLRTMSGELAIFQQIQPWRTDQSRYAMIGACLAKSVRMVSKSGIVCRCAAGYVRGSGRDLLRLCVVWQKVRHLPVFCQPSRRCRCSWEHRSSRTFGPFWRVGFYRKSHEFVRKLLHKLSRVDNHWKPSEIYYYPTYLQKE